MGTIRWVFQDLLARSSRPGYSSQNVEPSIVDEWIQDAKQLGIQSIICLLSEDQLAYYSLLTDGLLSEYRINGFNVCHIPITDPADDFQKGSQELNESLEVIYNRYLSLPKPVLIHCSAGCDRTGRAVEYIRQKTG